MAIKKQFKTKFGISIEEAYLKLEYIGFAAKHHKEKNVMFAHFQVFASEEARREGVDFIDVFDVEVKNKEDLMQHVYNQVKEMPGFESSVDA